MRTEKETKKLNKIVTVEEEVDVFITDDGEKFYTLKEAEKHEKTLTLEERRVELKRKLKIYEDFIFIDGELCYIESVEDAIEYYEIGYCGSVKKALNLSENVLPNWFIYEREDGGDYRDDHYFSPVQEVLPDFNLILAHMKDNRVEEDKNV